MSLLRVQFQPDIFGKLEYYIKYVIEIKPSKSKNYVFHCLKRRGLKAIFIDSFTQNTGAAILIQNSRTLRDGDTKTIETLNRNR